MATTVDFPLLASRIILLLRIKTRAVSNVNFEEMQMKRKTPTAPSEKGSKFVSVLKRLRVLWSHDAI